MTLRETSRWVCVAVVLSLTLHSSHSMIVAGLSADPPRNIQITDLGHLGQLSIEWSRPSSLENLTDCSIHYQLRYYDTYTKRWKSIRTLGLSYTAQFDLEKPVQVRMLTLLRGACMAGAEALGEEVEAVYTPEHSGGIYYSPSEPLVFRVDVRSRKNEDGLWWVDDWLLVCSGLPGSRIKDFGCVYFNKEYMACTWEPGPPQSSDSEHYLYYWHREMQETEECPEYILSEGIRRGCRFPVESLLEFSDFNICVNGSSGAGELEPAFYSLAIQNHVKPAEVSNFRVVLDESMLHAEWEPPAGPVPDQCLEYQLESTTVSHTGSEKQHTSLTEETKVEFQQEPKSTRSCIRVRSKVNPYCADTGFWSEWSPSRCVPEMTDYKPLWKGLPLILASSVVVVLIICLTLWIVNKKWKNRTEQKDLSITLYQEKVQKVFPSTFSSLI